MISELHVLLCVLMMRWDDDDGYFRLGIQSGVFLL